MRGMAISPGSFSDGESIGRVYSDGVVFIHTLWVFAVRAARKSGDFLPLENAATMTGWLRDSADELP
jgi:hypothetical protein